jgi:hypothetical protein
MAPMDNSAQRPSYQQVKAMIKQFTGQANTLVIPRVFIDLTGDHLAALLLSQILYWSDKTDNPDGWFYKTADEWQAEIGMSGYQVRRAATILAKFGVVTEVHKVKTTPKMHYRIDMSLFTDLILKFLENQEVSNSRNYTLENQETSKSMESEETSKSYKEHRLPETTSREGGAKAPAHTPAAQAYFETYPTERLNADQIDQINATVTDIRKWREVLRYWKASNYRPQSIPKMLDRYSSGTTVANDRPGGNRQQNSARAPADLPLVTAGADKKQIATPEERKRIIEARMARK